jgi:hypothetical protein
MPLEPGPGVPPDLYLMEHGRPALGPVITLRPLVWQHAQQATAKAFDTGLYLLSVALDTLHLRYDVDSEDKMSLALDQADERMSRCLTELRGAGEPAGAEALASGLATAVAPARDHLARVKAAPCVHNGSSRALRISSEEYLILCTQCPAPAERLRVYPEGVYFARRTGAVSPPYYPVERAPAIFSMLERDGAGALCAELERESRRIIGYCPDCRALYCPRHYEAHETWSGSWFDELHGTCAKGHRRELA